VPSAPRKNVPNARRLATYARDGVQDLDTLLSTFEARAKLLMDRGERRIRRRRREALKDAELTHDPMTRYGSKKPSLNEYEGHE
jgi:hypothetical protein